MLSSLTPDQFDRFLSRAELTATTPKSIVKPDLLRREVENVRRAGMAIDDGEFDSELRCVALPVRDFSGQIIGALGLSGPMWRMSHEVLQKHARAVRAAAARLSAEFGYTGEVEPRTDAAE
jgi:DNA-binding IclR family transcriptional regulator